MKFAVVSLSVVRSQDFENVLRGVNSALHSPWPRSFERQSAADKPLQLVGVMS